MEGQGACTSRRLAVGGCGWVGGGGRGEALTVVIRDAGVGPEAQQLLDQFRPVQGGVAHLVQPHLVEPAQQGQRRLALEVGVVDGRHRNARGLDAGLHVVQPTQSRARQERAVSTGCPGDGLVCNVGHGVVCDFRGSWGEGGRVNAQDGATAEAQTRSSAPMQRNTVRRIPGRALALPEFPRTVIIPTETSTWAGTPPPPGRGGKAGVVACQRKQGRDEFV